MKKLKSSLLVVLFCSFIFLVTVDVSFAQRVTTIEEEADRRIEQLNRDLMTIGIFGVEKVLGPLSRAEKPRLSFIVNWDFHGEGPRILTFIELLEKHKNLKECSRCLDALNELFYLQFRQLIVELNINRTSEIQFDQNNVDSHRDIHFKGFRDKNNLFGSSNKYAKLKLLEILFKVYDCQSIRNDDAFRYSYESPVLAMLMTKIAINVFRARSHINWSYEKREDFLAQKLDRFKKELLIAFNQVSKKNVSVSNSILVQDLVDFVDVVKITAIERIMPFPWGSVIKWTLIGGATIATAVGIAYGLYMILGGVGQVSANKIKEASYMIKDASDNIKGIATSINDLHKLECKVDIISPFKDFVKSSAGSVKDFVVSTKNVVANETKNFAQSYIYVCKLIKSYTYDKLPNFRSQE